MVDRWVVGRMCGKNLNVKDIVYIIIYSLYSLYSLYIYIVYIAYIVYIIIYSHVKLNSRQNSISS